MKKTFKNLLAVVILTLTLMGVLAVSSSAASDGKWICAWGTAPTKIGINGYENITAMVGNVTLRTVITPTASGTKIRIRLTNYYGTSPLTINSVYIAKSIGGSSIDRDTSTQVKFNGKNVVTIPAGKECYSDPVDFQVTAQEDVAMSAYVENFEEIKTMGLSGSASYLSFGKDETVAGNMGLNTEIDQTALSFLNKIGIGLDLKLSYSFIKVTPCFASLDVYSDKNAYSVITVGDSTIANEFPLYLSEAICNQGVTNVGVGSKAIIGNRLLGEGLGYGSLIFGESMIDRLQRDVLSQSGVKYVIVKIGANDIMHPVCTDIQQQYPGIKQPTAKEIIAGYSQVFKACHDAGMKAIAIGITQWKGNDRDYLGTGAKYVRTDEEFAADWKIATDVNAWLSTTNEVDGYVYYNDISADPNDPTAFRPEYTIDGAHPSDTLQRIWGANFPLSLIGIGQGVAGVTLNKTTATLYVGGTTVNLNETIKPADAKDKTVTWKSSNTKVATVSNNGVVTPVANGKAVITCTSNNNSKYYATCTVTVKTHTTGVTMSETAFSVYTTRSHTLSTTVTPSNASDKTVAWTSSNTKVATVSSNGTVKGVGSGTAVITATTTDGSYQAKATVTVVKKTEVTSLTISESNLMSYVGGRKYLKYTISPSNATFKDITWTTENAKVATVSADGLVTAVGAGTTNIVCKSDDNKLLIQKCQIKVYNPATGLKLDYSKMSVYVKASKGITATVVPSNASVKTVTWKSSNTNVATVSSSGVVTGVRAGKATITCTTKSKGFVKTCEVTVVTPVYTKTVKLNKTSMSIYAGSTSTITATVSPSNATFANKLTWTSSNTNIAKVSSTGKVTAVRPGSATITCKTIDTGKTATCKVTVKEVMVTGVKLNKTSVTLDAGKSYQLSATLSPSNATNKNVTWSSSDSSIVKVSSTGKVTALKSGKTATITCKTNCNKKIATCVVKTNAIKVTGVKLNKSAAVISYGATITLKATVAPSNASNKTVIWSTSNSKVATVSSKGVVKGVGSGNCIISCRTKDGGYAAICIIQVKANKVLGITLNKTAVAADKGASFQLTATIVPTNASNKQVKWTTSNAKVATVSSTGKVKAISKGTAEIRATSVDGNYIAVCKVTVK